MSQGFQGMPPSSASSLSGGRRDKRFNKEVAV